MLENCKTAHERWGGVHQLIDNWLAERKKLIVLYCNLSASKPLSAEQSLGENVGCFCQVMMDYCSAGHFEIYEGDWRAAFADDQREFLAQALAQSPAPAPTAHATESPQHTPDETDPPPAR